MRKGQTQPIRIAGKTVTQIAEIFGCTRYGIYERIKRDDPVLKAWAAERDARLKAEAVLDHVAAALRYLDTRKERT